MDKLTRQILKNAKKEEKHHVPTIAEIEKENDALINQEEKISKMLTLIKRERSIRPVPGKKKRKAARRS